MLNMVVRGFTWVVGWFVQVTGEKLLNDKLEELTNKRCRFEFENDAQSLKSQLTMANSLLLTAHESEITNKYLLLSVKDLEKLVCAAMKMLDDLGSCSCCCVKSSTDISNTIGQEIKQEQNGISLYFPERNIIPKSETGAQAVSCQVCNEDTENNRSAKRRKLNRDESSHRARELTNQLREMGNHVHGALQLETVRNLVRETQSLTNIIKAAIREDGKLKFVQEETREVSHGKEGGPTKDARVVERHAPHSDLKNVKIAGYNGSVTPTLSDAKLPDLTNLGTLHLKDFTNLKVLPPLGQLAHLKSLCLENFPAIKEVTREFYGSGAIKGFPSLQELSLHYLPECKTWAGRDDCAIFPRLEKLTLTKCPKLKRLPCDCGSDDGCCPPGALKKLFVYDCPGLTLPALPHAHVLSEESTSE